MPDEIRVSVLIDNDRRIGGSMKTVKFAKKKKKSPTKTLCDVGEGSHP